MMRMYLIFSQFSAFNRSFIADNPFESLGSIIEFSFFEIPIIVTPFILSIVVEQFVLRIFFFYFVLGRTRAGRRLYNCYQHNRLEQSESQRLESLSGNKGF